MQGKRTFTTSVLVPLELYYVPEPNKPKKSVPLTKVDYNVEVSGTLARVAITQNYRNHENNPINVFYQFPVSEASVFGGLIAEFQGRSVTGKIKEKNQAQAEFKEHKKKGDMVAYAEKNKRTPDIMNVELGNFPSGEELKITFIYFEKLTVSYNKLFRFTIPSTLTPRFESQKVPVLDDDWTRISTDPKNISEDEFFGVNDQNPSNQLNKAENFTWTTPYTWNIKVRITQTQNLTQLFTSTHRNECITSIEKTGGSLSFDNTMDHFPNKDFEMFFAYYSMFDSQVNIGRVMPEPGQENRFPEYCAEISFVPQMFDFIQVNKLAGFFDKNFDENERKNSDKNKSFFEVPDEVPVTNIDTVIDQDELTGYMLEKIKSEYIFVLDRSGSMHGDRIKRAVEALKFFLKSLPVDSYFNIYSFGDKFDTVYEKSVKFNQENLNDAIVQISSFDADYGGTEIYDPLDHIFNQETMPKYQKNIFLLTDGSVLDADGIIWLIQNNCSDNKFRVFTVGIGNGCSSYLVTKAAKAGHGKHELIPDKGNIEAKIVQLLAKSYSPSITNFQVIYDTNVINYVAPVPQRNSHILRDEPFRCYVMFSSGLLQNDQVEINMKYYSQAIQTNCIHKFVIDLKTSTVINTGMFHKLAIKSMFDESKNFQTSSTIPNHLELIDMAINYQVLCDETAFICVIKENQSNMAEKGENVIVPNLISNDYREQDDSGNQEGQLNQNLIPDLKYSGMDEKCESGLDYGNDFIGNNFEDEHIEELYDNSFIYANKDILLVSDAEAKNDIKQSFGDINGNLSEEANKNIAKVSIKTSTFVMDQPLTDVSSYRKDSFEKIYMPSELDCGQQMKKQARPAKGFMNLQMGSNQTLLDYRMIDGNFKYNQNLQDILEINDENQVSLKKSIGKDYNNDVLVTLMSLAYIKANPTKFGAEISIMISKSKNWLKNQIGQDMETVNTCIDFAMKNLF